MATPTKKIAPAQPAASQAKQATPEPGSDAFAFSDAAREQYDALLKSLNENAEEFQGRTQEFFDATREGFETAQSRLQEASAEAMDAARQEMTEAVDFANDLARAKTVADALEIQREYWTRLFETRVERTRDATQAAVDAMREVVEPMNKSMGAAFNNTPPLTTFFPQAVK